MKKGIIVRSINLHPIHLDNFCKFLNEGFDYQVVDLTRKKELNFLEVKEVKNDRSVYVIKHGDLIPSKFDIRKFVNSLERIGYKEVIFISKLGRNNKFLVLNTLKKLERDVEITRVFKNGRIEKSFLEFQPYVYAYTGFTNKEGMPAFVLAFLEAAHPRNIPVEKEKAEDINYVSEFIRKHYRSCKGELKYWGKIKFYVYHNGFGRTFTFDVDGNLKEEVEKFTGGLYRLRIKGVNIFKL